MPDFALGCSNLPDATTLDALDAGVWTQMPQLSPALERYLLQLVATEMPQIGWLLVLPVAWLKDLPRVERIPWRPRIVSALQRAGLYEVDRLAGVTFNDILALRTIGVRLMLEFAVVLEAAVLDAPAQSGEAPTYGNRDGQHDTQDGAEDPGYRDPQPADQTAPGTERRDAAPDGVDAPVLSHAGEVPPAGLRWGAPGVPLLPQSLRSPWAEAPLPPWLSERLGLPAGTTLAALDATLWGRIPSQPYYRSSLERYVVTLLATAGSAVAHVAALGRPWPEGLDPSEVPWRARTRNALERGGLSQDVDRLSRVTFGELLALRSMGAVSALDFAATAEAVIERVEAAARAAALREEAMVEALRDVVGDDWADLIAEDDPRFVLDADMVEAGGAHASTDVPWIAVRPMQLEGDMEVLPRIDGPLQLALFTDEVQLAVARAKEIEAMPLDIALRDYMAKLSKSTGPRVDALLMRFGWHGSPPATLEEASQVLGVTRERMRQLQAGIRSKRPRDPVFLPSLDRALDALAQAAPIGAREAAQLLQQRGITTIPFHPSSVLAAVEFFNGAATFSLDQGSHGPIVVTDSAQAYANRIAILAARRAGAAGVSNIAEVSAAAEGKGLVLSTEQVKGVLMHYSKVEFLNDEWFWMPSAPADRNRLHNTTRRILSVSRPITVAALREGVRRVFRKREHNHTLPLIVPPRAVLQAFYRAHPAFVVTDDGRIDSVEPLDYRSELGAAERTLVEVLRSSPTGLLPRDEFAEACVARGVNPATFDAYLTYSPIIEHLGENMWGLRGATVDPVAVEELRGELAQRRLRCCTPATRPSIRSTLVSVLPFCMSAA